MLRPGFKAATGLEKPSGLTTLGTATVGIAGRGMLDGAVVATAPDAGGTIDGTLGTPEPNLGTGCPRPKPPATLMDDANGGFTNCFTDRVGALPVLLVLSALPMPLLSAEDGRCGDDCDPGLLGEDVALEVGGVVPLICTGDVVGVTSCATGGVA